MIIGWAGCCLGPSLQGTKKKPEKLEEAACLSRAQSGAWERHSHLPSGFLQGPAGGGWAHWLSSGSGGLGTCSAGGGCASVSAVSCTGEGWVSLIHPLPLHELPSCPSRALGQEPTVC